MADSSNGTCEIAPNLLRLTPAGLYCPAARCHIDPWCPVDRAVITHAHTDHACPGSAAYLTAAPGAALLRLRIGDHAAIRPVNYGETLQIGPATLSLHPAGHMLGAAQVRIELHGHVAVVSGDYHLLATAAAGGAPPNPTCAPFELVPCHTFVTEATFALPIYRWPPPAELFAEIHAWWRANQDRARTSVLYAYALGKAQRLLAGLDPSIGPLGVHGAVARFLPAYAAAGVPLPHVVHAGPETARSLRGRGLIVAPPTADGPWLRKFGPASTAFVSGWMQIRGARRWRSLDRGFALSDHADWPGLLHTIAQTGAERIGVTHGYARQLARYLREQGRDALVVPTRYGDEDEGQRSAPAEGAPEQAAHPPRTGATTKHADAPATGESAAGS